MFIVTSIQKENLDKDNENHQNGIGGLNKFSGYNYARIIKSRDSKISQSWKSTNLSRTYIWVHQIGARASKGLKNFLKSNQKKWLIFYLENKKLLRSFRESVSKNSRLPESLAKNNLMSILSIKFHLIENRSKTESKESFIDQKVSKKK